MAALLTSGTGVLSTFDPGDTVVSISNTGVVVAGVLALLIGALALYVGSLKVQPDFPSIPASGNPREGSQIQLLFFDNPENKLVGRLVSSPSPYCSKIETYCRFTGVPYTIRTGSSSEAPKGKVPYMKHGAYVVADSTFIARYINATWPDKALPAAQDAQLAGAAYAAQVLAETALSPIVAYFRWVDREGYEFVKSQFFSSAPALVREILPPVLRKQIYGRLCSQGLAKFSVADLEYQLERHVGALSAVLGDKEYLTGGQPVEADAAVFGLLDGILNDGNSCTIPRDAAAKHPNLMAYVDRIRSRYYADRLATLKEPSAETSVDPDHTD